ncbi:MAG: hypothetical protein GX130_03125 [Candidatus Hydrogenedens sp.]|nr:hypothetical protein [Candidatus Hydrogenedens sp.]
MKQTFRKAKKGVVFHEETGKLYRFSPDKIEVMIAWPEPRAWRKTKQRACWESFRPNIHLTPPNSEKNSGPDPLALEHNIDLAAQGNLIPELAALFAKEQSPPERADSPGQQLLPLEGFLSREEQWSLAIPEDIRTLVAGFQQRQWHMLSFLARCGSEARELTENNPALAFALASNWVFHKPAVQRPLRAARNLLRKKQRHILAWLGFPATEATRRILAKIIPESITILQLLYLRDALEEPGMMKRLGHLPALNGGMLRLLTDRRLAPHSSHHLLLNTLRMPMEIRHHATAYLLTDCLAMYELLYPEENAFPQLNSHEEVQGYHDVLMRELHHYQMDESSPFPPPPLPGTDTIVPVCSAEELAEEGRIQNHCVATYLPRIVAQKNFYVYKVLAPERATLAIEKRRGLWKLKEVKLANNRSVSLETQRAVQSWISRCYTRMQPSLATGSR